MGTYKRALLNIKNITYVMSSGIARILKLCLPTIAISIGMLQVTIEVWESGEMFKSGMSNLRHGGLSVCRFSFQPIITPTDFTN